jgi:hypothetical protein
MLEKGLAVRVWARQRSLRRSSAFFVSATVADGPSADYVARVLRRIVLIRNRTLTQTLAALVARGPAPRDEDGIPFALLELARRCGDGGAVVLLKVYVWLRRLRGRLQVS